MEDVGKAVGFEYFREEGKGKERTGGVDVVVVVGGLTYMEVAGMRLLRTMVEGEKLVMITTEMIESFAMLIASSSSLNLITESTGPNISSFAIRIEFLTSAKIVGAIK